VSESGIILPPLGWLEQVIFGGVSNGAVADLRTSSDYFQDLPAAEIRAHAIVGTGGPFVLATGASVPGPQQAWIAALAGCFQLVPFGLQTHDLIVPRDSQIGLLPTPAVTEFGFLSVVGYQNGLHTYGVTRDERVNDRVVELLNARVADAMFAQNGFPAYSSKGTLSSAPPGPTPVDGLEIVNPTAGAIFTAGQSIRVSVDPINGFVPTRVVVVSSTDGEIIEKPPFECSLDIAPEAIGSLTITAIGFDANGVLAVSDPVIVEITTNAEIVSLSMAPQPVQLFEFTPTRHLNVAGLYSDGVQRDVTTNFGVTYSTLDTTIATVSVDGLVTSVHVGTTTVTATVNGISASAAVNVLAMPCPADVTDDGSVSVADLLAVITAWGPCLPGPAGCPADIAPSPPNGAVGVDDLLAVIGNWGSCPQ
jgi:hypothetical protein